MQRLQLTIILAVFSFGTLLSQTNSLLADYPLVTDSVDATGNNDDILLENAPFGNGGVYSNGIYYGNDNSGSVIQTPQISNFDFDNFTVKLDFFIESYPEFNKPIIICGASWRWMGAYLDTDRLAFMANDKSDYIITDEVVALNQWNTISLEYNRPLKKAQLFLNGKPVASQIIPILEHNDDGRFSNEHGGTGDTFKGYWRNLKLYDSSDLSAIGEKNELTGIEVSVSQNRLTIVVPRDEKSVAMQVFDMGGNEISTHNLSSGTNSINTTLFRPGSYLLVFTNKSGQKAVGKIIIL